MPQIPLGSWVRDTITGYSGVVTACLLKMGDAPFYAVQSRELYNGQPRDEYWFTEGRLERLKPPTTK